jgi:prepilin-type N-terminal cleavage/methylation domain-containing protein
MSSRKSQSGFSPVELVIVLAVVAVLAVVGYTVYNRQNSRTATTQPANSQPAATDAETAPTISSAKDLDKAGAALDRTDPGGSNDADVNQLDAQLSGL